MPTYILGSLMGGNRPPPSPLMVFTADPGELLKGLVDLCAELWDAQPGQADLDLQPIGGLPAPSVGELRAVSQSYSPHFATSVGGLYMTHFALLGDGGLEALGVMFGIMESMGALPSQVQTIMVIMLGKPKGGFRPIGLFTSFYRLWAKTRRPYAEAWDAKSWRPCFACGAGRGAQDTVWRQTVKAEVGVADEKVFCSLLWDMGKFYELFCLSGVSVRAWHLEFPIQMMRVSIAAYSGPRHLSLAGRVSVALYASNGMVAGCNLAITYIGVYCAIPFDTVVYRCPSVSLDAYIDDITVSSLGTADQLNKDIAAGGMELHRAIGQDLVCQIAMDKPALVASSQKTMVSIRRVFGQLAGGDMASTVNLGVDYTSGGSRVKQGRSSKRAERFAAAAKRRVRARMLKRVLGATVDFRNFIVFFVPIFWHIEIRHRVKQTYTINLLGFEILKLKI